MEAEAKTLLDNMGKAWNELKLSNDTLVETVTKRGDKDAVFEESVKKCAADVAQLHEQCTKQFEEMATKLNRVATEAPETEDSREQKKDAAAWKRTNMVRKGALAPGQELPEGYVEEYNAYSKALPLYIRYGENPSRGVDTKALSAGNDQDGGFFIRPVWSNRIITKIFESSPIRQFATVESISGPELKYPVDIDEAATGGWVGEMTDRPATSTPQIKEKSIIAHEQYALPKATQTILEDAGIDAEAWLMGKIADKFARFEATAFVTGDGAAKPKGLLSYPDGTSWGQVQQYGSGSSGAFVADKLVSFVAQLKEPYHANARFFIRRETMSSIMTLKDGLGQYIFLPIFQNGFNNAPLLGYPITYAADIPAVGAGAKAMIFGDIKTAYTVVDRIGLSMLRDPFSYKPFVGFYVRKRVGGDVLNFEAYKIHVLS